MAEKILNTSIVLRNDTKSNWDAVASTATLRVGEIGIESDTGLFKIGKEIVVNDIPRLATWGELQYANEIPEVDLTTVTNNVKVEASLEALGTGSVVGDMGIVKAPLYEGSTDYSYTAYVWNGTDWAAMDGNYSAENVFTSKKITLAGNFSSIGNYSKGKEIAAGTSMQTLLSGMLQTTIQPSITASPTATISASGNEDGEVGSSYTLPTATLTVTTGSYTNEGSATGVKYTAGNVTIAYGADPDNATYTTTNTTDLGNNGTVQIAPSKYSAGATTALYTDTKVGYTFSGKATHTAGVVAKDNLGENSDPVIQIASASPTVDDVTANFRGYRKMFCGSTNEALTSSVIRGLSLKSAKASTSAFTVTAKIGATNLVVACPTSSLGKNYTLSKAEMMTMGWEDYTSEFATKDQVQVADYRGGSNGLQNYNIYVYEFAALKADTQFRITLK